MKVLHITNAYPYKDYTSYGIFIKEQIDSLANNDVITEVIFINARKYGKKEYLKYIHIIRQKIKSFKPDILHCHHEFSLIPLLFIKHKKPVLLSVLGDIKQRSNFNKLTFRFLKLFPKRIIFKNSILNKEKYLYLPNGVNLNHFYEIDKNIAKLKLGLDTKKDYALFVTATINNPIKRYDKFCAVIDELKRFNINIEPLVLSGVSRDMVPFYFNSSTILILTSDHEGSPNAVKEAMACNIPVVSTNVGNVKFLFGQTKGLYVSESPDIKDITTKCINAIKDKKSDGRNRLINLNLDMNSVSIQLYTIYQNLLK